MLGTGRFCGKFRDWWLFPPSFPCIGPLGWDGKNFLDAGSFGKVPSLLICSRRLERWCGHQGQLQADMGNACFDRCHHFERCGPYFDSSWGLSLRDYTLGSASNSTNSYPEIFYPGKLVCARNPMKACLLLSSPLFLTRAGAATLLCLSCVRFAV